MALFHALFMPLLAGKGTTEEKHEKSQSLLSGLRTEILNGDSPLNRCRLFRYVTDKHMREMLN